jgi:hypothetical protein
MFFQKWRSDTRGFSPTLATRQIKKLKKKNLEILLHFGQPLKAISYVYTTLSIEELKLEFSKKILALS